MTHERLVPLQEQRKAFQEMWLGFLKHKVESGGWKCPVLVWGVGTREIASLTDTISTAAPQPVQEGAGGHA